MKVSHCFNPATRNLLDKGERHLDGFSQLSRRCFRSSISDQRCSVGIRYYLCMIAITIRIDADDLFFIGEDEHSRAKLQWFCHSYSHESFFFLRESNLKRRSQTIKVKSAYRYDCFHGSQIVCVNSC